MVSPKPPRHCYARPSLAPSWQFLAFLLLGLVFLHPRPLLALGEERRVSFEPVAGALLLADDTAPIALLTAQEDWPGVQRAARDLSDDFARVLRPSTLKVIDKLGSTTYGGPAPTTPATIIIGTLGRSPIIDALAKAGRIDAEAIRGKWEAHLAQLVDNPAPGIARALVIAGSDKRGTIYGIYGLSQQIGVSPWYWWADVPVQTRKAVYALPSAYMDAGPVVRYRGIFLNDEAPALSGWTKEKFGGVNSQFYTKVFELLLRLRGNYLWPAMWNNAFNEDDPANPILADEYGIVMGTSHHEPMIRSQQEWKRHGSGHWNYDNNSKVLADFWSEGIRRNKNLESIVTMGMRGDGDEPMSEDSNVALLQRIVKDQRDILVRETGKPIAEIPQMWALYKEVQEYYEKGMRVPDDVTLLWCDDNWGNIRRLPTPEERKRAGGAGVYYHFDYVGDPRNYKWINTVQLSKTWEQMNLAWKHDATRIWIVNVGDLKPMELPIDFFLNLAWNPAAWPLERLPDYTRLWAEREFGAAQAASIASIVERTTLLNARIKPELLTPDTYSLVNYQEAERVMEDWIQLRADSDRVSARLPASSQDAYFQLVDHPLRAAAIVNDMLITAGRNRMYAIQGRRSTNALAARVRELFAEDAAMTVRYHALNGGKWNHQMDQTHLGYTYWQQPPCNVMPAVNETQIPSGGKLGVAIEGSTIPWPDEFGKAVLPALESWTRKARYIEVFTQGAQAASFSITSSVPWLQLTQTKGEVDGDLRIWVNADWDKVPAGTTNAQLIVKGTGIGSLSIALPVHNPVYPKFGDTTAGFVESDGAIAIEAAHYSQAVVTPGRSWMTIPGYGRTLSAVSALPGEAESVVPGAASPHLEYKLQVFTAGEVTLEAQLSPTLSFVPHRGLRYAVSLDDEDPIVVDLKEGFDNIAWRLSVSESTRRSFTKLKVSAPGAHTLKFWLVDPGVVLQRLVLTTTKRPRPSFLGPEETVVGTRK